MAGMGFVDVAHVSVVLPDGRVLLDDVSFRVGEGAKAALVGANGAGKTTLLRVVAGDLAPSSGAVARVRRARRDAPVHRLDPGRHHGPRAAARAGPAGACGRPATQLEAAEWALAEAEDEPTQLRYAAALADWGDAGGYDAEVLWDTVHRRRARRCRCDRAQHRHGPHAVRRRAEAARAGGAAARPGRGAAARRAGQLPRRAGQALAGGAAAGDAEDRAVRQPRPRAARPHGRPGGHRRGARRPGCTAAASGRTRPAREARLERLDELHRRWEEEHDRLKELVRTLQQQAKISHGDGLPLPGDADPAGQVRGGRAAAGAAGRAEGRRCGCAAGAPACAR